MHSIMKQHPIVKERLWRVSGIRTAILLLASQPEYQVRAIRVVGITNSLGSNRFSWVK